VGGSAEAHRLGMTTTASHRNGASAVLPFSDGLPARRFPVVDVALIVERRFAPMPFRIG
jgi:hypothetical protein